jgi:cytoskeleton protein RodZ
VAEIGASLREARMRQRIDITDMEVRTKIRAKYLRALENEEWDLLPGPTYVRSFLRTYAEALGLDSKLLVEEYKLRHTALETGELHPIRRPTARERERRRRREPRGVPIAAVVGLVFAAIVVLLFLIGRGAEPDEGSDRVGSAPAETQPRDGGQRGSGGGGGDGERRERRRPRTVRLQLVPTGPVSVCLVDAGGRVLIANETLQPGRRTRTFRSRRFRLSLGNNAVTLRINGRARTVPPSGEPIGYTITRNGRTDLPPERRPTCGG